jgi:hypothetical protein
LPRKVSDVRSFDYSAPTRDLLLDAQVHLLRIARFVVARDGVKAAHRIRRKLTEVNHWDRTETILEAPRIRVELVNVLYVDRSERQVPVKPEQRRPVALCVVENSLRLPGSRWSGASDM